MKLTLTLSFFLLCQLGLAQRMGMINDPDGYTNVRSGEGTNFDVIAKILEGERFKYFESESSNWWKIETVSYHEAPVQGFVYKSRIQPFVDSKDDCSCVQPWGPTEEDPELTATIGESSVTVCGYLHQKYNEKSVKISEFAIADCSTDKMMAFFGAVTTCKVTVKEDALEIIVLEKMPVGSGLKWKEVPYKRFMIENELGYPKLSAGELILNLDGLGMPYVKAFEDKLPSYKGKGYFDELEDFIGKLAICAMKGSEVSETVFYDINNYLNFVIDGHLKEFHRDCERMIEEYKSR